MFWQRPDKQEVFDGRFDAHSSWNKHDSRAMPGGNESRECSWHGLEAVSDRNSVVYGGNLQNIEIAFAGKTNLAGSLAIEGRLVPANSFEDSPVKVGVAQKPHPHLLLCNSALRLACSSLR